MPETVPRMRGYKAAIAELKKVDPESAVSEYWLRSATKKGLIPYIKAGGRDLLNYDALLLLLANPPPSVQSERYGVIRPISIVK